MKHKNLFSNKHVALQNSFIHYTWKNIRQQYKNDKSKIISPAWNDEFELSDGSYSVSDIQDYIECIIKRTRIKILSPKKMLNRLPVLFLLFLLFIFISTKLIIN